MTKQRHRLNSYHAENHAVFSLSSISHTTLGVVILSFVLRRMSEVRRTPPFEKWYTEITQFEIYWEYRDTIYFLILVVLFALVLRYFSWFLLDETRHVKNHPHKHVYARIRGVWYDFAQFDHPGGPIVLNLAKDRDATALFFIICLSQHANYLTFYPNTKWMMR